MKLILEDPGGRGWVLAFFGWSVVTMTTVGYGDKAPRTGLGKVVGLLWMFISVIIIAALTGAIATKLTVDSLTPSISGPHDLHDKEVGTIKETVGDHYLNQVGIASVNSPYLTQLNIAVLRIIEQPDWDAKVLRFGVD